MSDAEKSSKTEQPTAKRLGEAKKKGVPHSRDMTSTVTLLVAILALSSTSGHMVNSLRDITRDILSSAGTYEVTEAGAFSMLLRVFGTILSTIGPFMVIVVVAGLVVTVAQTGFSINSERLEFTFDKLNPLTNFKKLFNKDSAMEAAKAIFKILIVGFMAYRILKSELDGMIFLTESDLTGIMEFVSRISMKIVVHTCGVMMVLAVLDLAFVKWRFIDNLKMTKQEVKEETKESEGDAQVKGKIRQMQFERSRRRLMKIIPTADVVVTNPTHFAVALKYDRDKMVAPMVLAKGMDHMAQQIKAIARENNVMLVENRFLARELYAQVKEGQEIPEALYAAVAEVLAYVYSLKGKI